MISILDKHELPIDIARQLDQLCSQFEAAWNAGERPVISEFLTNRAEPARSMLLRELLHLDIAYRHRAGEHPAAADYPFEPADQVILSQVLGEYAAGTPRDEAPPVHTPIIEGRSTMPAPPGQPVTNSTLDDVAANDTGESRRWQAPARRFAHGADGSEVDLSFLSPPHGPDELGRLGSYRITKFLKEGGMGVVFQAEDTNLNRLVALKAIQPRLAATTAAKQRFLREARAAAALKHPHIVTVFQVGEDNGTLFLAMELLEGETLQSRIERSPAPALPETLRIGREIAMGLAAAHAKGLVHRDIKPLNIFLEGDKAHAKILDFGLVRAETDEARLTVVGVIPGTLGYIAPEHAGCGTADKHFARVPSDVIDPRSDLFSLGCVLYRMCAGELPFQGSDIWTFVNALATTHPAPPIAVNPKVPLELSELVMHLLAKKPEDRPESAEVVAEMLERLERHGRFEGVAKGYHDKARPPDEQESALSQRDIHAGPANEPAPVKSRLRAAWLLAGGVVALIAIVAIGISLALMAPSREKIDEATTPKVYVNRWRMEFVLVPKGKAWLGGGGGKVGNEQVLVADDFYLGKYEVTQAQWHAVMGANPSHFSSKGPGRNELKDVPDADSSSFPVENVSWDDAQTFLKKLNASEKSEHWVYRLPTELEWEYACRGGPMTEQRESAFDFYLDGISNVLLPEHANFSRGKGAGTCAVGLFAPNRLGIHDMHGNVWEWCADDGPADPKGATRRIFRGGGWNHGDGHCRALNRGAYPPNIGYKDVGVRVARLPINKERARRFGA